MHSLAKERFRIPERYNTFLGSYSGNKLADTFETIERYALCLKRPLHVYLYSPKPYSRLLLDMEYGNLLADSDCEGDNAESVSAPPSSSIPFASPQPPISSVPFASAQTPPVSSIPFAQAQATPADNISTFPPENSGTDLDFLSLPGGYSANIIETSNLSPLQLDIDIPLDLQACRMCFSIILITFFQSM